jgi:hypothetical protein
MSYSAIEGQTRSFSRLETEFLSRTSSPENKFQKKERTKKKEFFQVFFSKEQFFQQVEFRFLVMQYVNLNKGVNRPPDFFVLFILAEEVRFELTIPFRVCRFSKPVPSTTQPLLRIFATLKRRPLRVRGFVLATSA